MNKVFRYSYYSAQYLYIYKSCLIKIFALRPELSTPRKSLHSPLRRTLAQQQQPGLLPNAFREQEGRLRERDYTLGISLCGKGSLWQDACILLDGMAKSKVSPTVFSYSAAISACEKGDQWQWALTFLYEGMPKAKVSPNVFSYNAAVSACEKGGQWQHALALFEDMPQKRINPDVISYNAAISACEKGGSGAGGIGLVSCNAFGTNQSNCD